MKITRATGLDSRIRNRRRFLVVVISLGMLLSVQTGLAYHDASHTHVEDEGSDCSFCVLGSHFAAEPVEIPSVESLGSAVGLSRENPDDSVQVTNRPSTARSPPVASV